MKRTTKAGVEEHMGQTQWMSPFHLNYPHGRPEEGIRSNAMLGNVLGKQLTDRRVDHYSRRGVYSNRRFYRNQLKEVKKVEQLMHNVKSEPRLVYNIETQEFEEVK